MEKALLYLFGGGIGKRILHSKHKLLNFTAKKRQLGVQFKTLEYTETFCIKYSKFQLKYGFSR